MTVTLILLALATFLATLAGGFFALRYTDRAHCILGFSAGAVIGVAFFDLLPEALGMRVGGSTTMVTTIVAVGFLTYLLFDRFFHTPHVHAPQEHGELPHEHEHRSMLRAGSFSVHSMLDGMAIGFAFQVAPSVGIVVAVAVLAHDFSDGINTVSAIMKGNGTKQQALKWLVVDALAPVLGIIATLFFTVSAGVLSSILALFCGFFLYIGASDLIPESYHAHPTKWTTFATILGGAVIYIVIRLAS